MRTLLLSGLVAWLIAAEGCPSEASRTTVAASVSGPSSVVSVGYFQDELEPWGTGIHHPLYGWCWTPYDVYAGWRPYSDGYWVYTEFGWTWASYEPWGWATYHYGRWVFDPDYGWLWVPGTVWAPAWVAWRYDVDWIGWAPLPPSAGWQVGIGLGFFDSGGIPTRNWCFVERDRFAEPQVARYVEPVARNITLMGRTRDVTRFESRRGKPFNRGPDLAAFERESRHAVRRAKAEEFMRPGRQQQGPPDRVERPAMRGDDIRVRRDRDDRGRRDRDVRERDGRDGPGRGDEDMSARRDAERRRLESALQEQRARLERAQERERSRPSRGGPDWTVRDRQERERREFEAHAAEQRRVLEQRLQKRIVKPAPQREAKEPRRRPDQPPGRERRDRRDG